MLHTFSMTEKEESRFEKFKTKHFLKCGTVASVAFTQTGVGVAVEAQCSRCNKRKI